MSNFSNSNTMSKFRFSGLYSNPRTITLDDSACQNKPQNNKLRVVTLFSGYGSQELALKYIGVDHEVVAHSDIFKPANEVFNALHTTQEGNLGDITKINENTFPQCDLLTYSFPCTNVSIAGNQEGISVGTQSGLLYEVERIVKVKQPKYLMMENVKNLVSKTHMASFQKHIDFLEGLGYGCYWRVLNAADFGCAQNRERVLMMAVLGESKDQVKAKMMRVDNHKMERTSMRPFIESEVSDKLFIDCEFVSHTGSNNSSVCKMVAKRTDVKYDQAQRIYSVDGCSPCLTKSGIPQIMTEDGKVRYISAREGYRFMGIKDQDIDKMLKTSLSEKQHVSLAGNSICVPVLEAIFTEFFKLVPLYGIWVNKGLRRIA
jgi:DNA (cytosine-5)-methyltransferase 1